MTRPVQPFFKREPHRQDVAWPAPEDARRLLWTETCAAFSNQARIWSTTSPDTSVSLKSRPMCR